VACSHQRASVAALRGPRDVSIHHAVRPLAYPPDGPAPTFCKAPAHRKCPCGRADHIRPGTGLAWVSLTVAPAQALPGTGTTSHRGERLGGSGRATADGDQVHRRGVNAQLDPKCTDGGSQDVAAGARA